MVAGAVLASARWWLSGLCACWLLCVAAPVSALPAELEYAKGVVAFSRGDLATARGHFSAVLKAQPEHAQATYYLGQVALGLDRFDEAISLFTRVTRLTPENAAVRLDLALALVKAKRFEQAETQLLVAKDPLSDRASLHYYLGYCRFQRGHYRAALEPLERALKLDSGFAASAGYYLGLAHHRLGQQAEAQRHFEHLASADGGGRMGSLARENLSVLAGQSRADPGRSWGMFVALGAGYDSNVILETNPGPGAGVPVTFFSLGGFYRPLRSRHHALDLALSFYRHFNIADQDDDADPADDSDPGPAGLNLTDLAAAITYRHRFSFGQRIELAYLFDLDLLDDRSKVGGSEGFGVFMQGHTGALRWRIPEGRLAETSLAYRFHWQGYDLSDRDNFGHEVKLRQDLAWVGGRVRLALELGALVEDARQGVEWDLWGLTADVETRFRIANSVGAWVRVGWRREDHHRSEAGFWEGQRVDDLFLGGLGVSWQVLEILSLGASYRYMNNDSNGISGSPFRYHRHLVQVQIMGRL